MTNRHINESTNHRGRGRRPPWDMGGMNHGRSNNTTLIRLRLYIEPRHRTIRASCSETVYTTEGERLMKMATVSRTMMAGLCVVLLSSGCSHMPGGIASSTTPIDGRDYRVIGPVSTTDSHVLLFGILPIKGSNAIRPAIQKCLAARGADALIEVTVESYTQFWLLFVRNVIKVEGMAIRFETR